jgi:ubiquinone/menaquinone biosynthesis C-methylase UbiE
MRAETVRLLCNPANHEALRLVQENGPRGRTKEYLAGVDSCQEFSIQDGIPIFISAGAVSGANKRYQTLYDRMARWYDISERVGARLVLGGRDKIRKEVVRDIRVATGDRVLEVSIGTGINLHYLPGAADYFGLDISMGMLRRCRKNLEKWHLEADLFQGEAEHLPFQDGVFDVVFHFGGINYFNDRSAAVSEMIRVAKQGTRIFIGDETKDLAGQYQKMPGFRRFYSSERIGDPKELVPTGMKDVKVETRWKGRLYMLEFTKP